MKKLPVKSGAEGQNRTADTVIFNFGFERDLIESNPCHEITPPAREQSRERVLKDDELRSF